MSAKRWVSAKGIAREDGRKRPNFPTYDEITGISVVAAIDGSVTTITSRRTRIA
jgi:hypothetical protein